MNTTIKVAIADDICLFSKTLENALQQDKNISIIKVVNTFDALVDYCNSSFFDILLLDVNFNGTNTLEKINLFRPNYKKFKIIVLTSLDNDYVKTLAHNANISAFVSKDTSLNRLCDTIIDCFNQTSYYKIEPKEKKQISIDGVKFTERKIQILKAIYEFSDLTDKELANMLGIAYSSIKTHKRELFEMTNTKGVPSLIKFGLKNGILL